MGSLLTASDGIVVRLAHPSGKMRPGFERADRIGSYWGNPATQSLAELLIDCEEDRILRAVLVGMLREADG
jgi:hypothetical protein